MACSAHSDTNVFVQMKRGGTLEAEWIICYAELLSEVTLTFLCTLWVQGRFYLHFLCWSLEHGQSSWGDYEQASGFFRQQSQRLEV